jgi:hypothetical protein
MGIGRTAAVRLSINKANLTEGSTNHGYLKTNIKYISIEYLSVTQSDQPGRASEVTRSLRSRAFPANDTP